MYKRILYLPILMSILTQGMSVSNLPVKNQDVSPKQLQKQNKQVAQLAAEAESKNLPQIVDKYTKIISIKAVNTTMVYTFEINTGSKSDNTVIKEDHTRMKKAITQGICKSARRFMNAQITKVYIYKSAISKKELFRFNIKESDCIEIYGLNYRSDL